jgi:hypothetical protein
MLARRVLKRRRISAVGGRLGAFPTREGSGMADAQNDGCENGSLLDGINARLSDAAQTGEALNLIITVRGRVSPVPGKHRGRWRVRTGRGYVLSFRSEFVVAFNGTGHAHEAPRATAPTGRVLSADPNTESRRALAETESPR